MGYPYGKPTGISVASVLFLELCITFLTVVSELSGGPASLHKCLFMVVHCRFVGIVICCKPVSVRNGMLFVSIIHSMI